MKILLLGATGRTGKLVLQKALNKGYHVTCLARNSNRIPKQDRLTIVEGNPTNEMDLANAMQGCDAVINVLNISRTSDIPWARLRTPKNYLSEVMSCLIPIAETHQLKRMAICSAWGAAETKNDIPFWFRWFIDNSNIGVAYRDHERQEEMLQATKLNWTIVRPVGLTNSKKKEHIRETFENSLKPNLFISRSSVADYLIDSLTRDELINKKVVISKG